MAWNDLRVLKMRCSVSIMLLYSVEWVRGRFLKDREDGDQVGSFAIMSGTTPHLNLSSNSRICVTIRAHWQGLAEQKPHN